MFPISEYSNNLKPSAPSSTSIDSSSYMNTISEDSFNFLSQSVQEKYNDYIENDILQLSDDNDNNNNNNNNINNNNFNENDPDQCMDYNEKIQSLENVLQSIYQIKSKYELQLKELECQNQSQKKQQIQQPLPIKKKNVEPNYKYFPCKYQNCSFQALKNFQLTRHIKQEHLKKLTFSCRCCKQKFSNELEKTQHEEKNHKLKIVTLNPSQQESSLKGSLLDSEIDSQQLHIQKEKIFDFNDDFFFSV